MLLSKTIANKGFLDKKLLSIDFNESCNNHCLGCPRNYRFSDKYTEYWSFDQAKYLIDYLLNNTTIKEMHIGILSEFCIYRYNSEILEYINTTYPNIKITVTTNLTRLSDKLLGIISKCNENVTINVSLWASNAIEYKKLHGNDSFDSVINNLNKLIDNRGNSKVMVSTVNYLPSQLDGVRKLIQNICNNHNIMYYERNDKRIASPNKLTLYINVFTDPNKTTEQVANITNDKVNYKCNLVSSGIYITYNKIFPCLNTKYRSKFNVKNLDDLKYKLMKVLENENTMEECKTCIVGHSCMNMKEMADR